MEKAKELIQLANGKDTLKYRDLGTPINVMKFNDLGVLPVKTSKQVIGIKLMQFLEKLWMKNGL